MQLRGIDLTCDPTQVPRYRAADILNVMPDPTTGNPRKRVGWRKVYAFGTGVKFLGSRHIADWGGDIIVTDGNVYWHSSSDTTWAQNTMHVLIQNGSHVDAGVGFVGFDADGKYRLNVYGLRYKLTMANGSVTADPISISYVPTTIISRNPDGTDGYAYEAVNAFTPERKIQFLGNDTDTDFYFYPAADRDNHVVLEINKVEQLDSDGEWVALDHSTDYTEITTGVTVSAYQAENKSIITTYGTVIGITLNAPAEPLVVGQDNIRVTIVESAPEEDENEVYWGYWNPIVDGISKNGTCARYGYMTMDREFYVTSDKRIYYTEADNYDYLPDNNYLTIEVDTPVIGFHRNGTALIAITGNSAEFTLFIITGKVGAITHSVLNDTGVRESSTEEYTYFTARTASAGTGAVAAKSFATLVDDPLFLSRHGIYGITSNNVTTETVVANRSELINSWLEQESSMQKAAATIWNGMYLLALNGHAYLLDSRVTHKNLGVSYGYECYYWDNVPATDLLSYDGNLFFGDNKGNWCRFNTDISNSTRFEDDGTLDQHGNLSGGTAIHAKYALKFDSDDAPQYFKTLNKRGTVLEMMQLTGSGVKFSYSKDGNAPVLIGSIKFASKFIWSLVDFENFTFDAAGTIRTYYPKKKVKKYKYLQFIIESDEKDEDFGICGLTKTYYFGNFAKG